MAYVQKLTDKRRTLPWRAQIRRKGHGVMVKMFASRREAEHLASEQERTIRLTGLPHTIEGLKKHTVGEIVRRYRDEITPQKACRVSEATVLNKFLRHKICSKSLAYISKQDAHEYIDDRKQDTWNGHPIKPTTIRRELNTIQHVFEVAKEKWGLTNLQNPFRGIPIKGSGYRRTRRLRDGELEALNKASQECRGLNRYYVPLAAYLAIETGMRLQEIFNLTWRDIDITKRRIEIRKSKTDYLSGSKGRIIVLTFLPLMTLMVLSVRLMHAKHFGYNHRVFPMTSNAFQQAWSDVCKRADVVGLTFHDLRHEAASRFDEAGLTKGEHDLMMGHFGKDMRSLYVHADLKSIQDKLDRHQLMGKTLAEWEVERRAAPDRKHFEFMKWLENEKLLDNDPRFRNTPLISLLRRKSPLTAVVR
jgi:integrase